LGLSADVDLGVKVAKAGRGRLVELAAKLPSCCVEVGKRAVGCGLWVVA
jgi:hypothetical protein